MQTNALDTLVQAALAILVQVEGCIRGQGAGNTQVLAGGLTLVPVADVILDPVVVHILVQVGECTRDRVVACIPVRAAVYQQPQVGGFTPVQEGVLITVLHQMVTEPTMAP